MWSAAPPGGFNPVLGAHWGPPAGANGIQGHHLMGSNNLHRSMHDLHQMAGMSNPAAGGIMMNFQVVEIVHATFLPHQLVTSKFSRRFLAF